MSRLHFTSSAVENRYEVVCPAVRTLTCIRDRFDFSRSINSTTAAVCGLPESASKYPYHRYLVPGVTYLVHMNTRRTASLVY